MEHSENIETPAGNSNSNGMQGITSKAEQKVRELRETARTEAEHRVHELTEKALQRIDSQRDRVATRIEDAASRLRERGDSAGSVGHMAGDQVATRMEAAAGYLHTRQSEEIASDVAAYVRQHPIQSIIAAAFLGYLFGRLTG